MLVKISLELTKRKHRKEVEERSGGNLFEVLKY